MTLVVWDGQYLAADRRLFQKQGDFAVSISDTETKLILPERDVDFECLGNIQAIAFIGSKEISDLLVSFIYDTNATTIFDVKRIASKFKRVFVLGKHTGSIIAVTERELFILTMEVTPLFPELTKVRIITYERKEAVCFGLGSEYALGAVTAGVTAMEAIDVAYRLSVDVTPESNYIDTSLERSEQTVRRMSFV